MDVEHEKIANDLEAILGGRFRRGDQTPEGRISEIERELHKTAKTDNERWAVQDACKKVKHLHSLVRGPTPTQRDHALQDIAKVRRASTLRKISSQNGQ